METTKTFKLTKNILQNMDLMRKELERVQTEMNSRLMLLLDGFAQGCGLEDNEIWNMTQDGLSIEFKPKEEGKELKSTEQE